MAAPHVREQRADGRLRRRDRDIDLAGLQQIDVGAAVDERHNAARTHALGKQARHDVVFVVVGHRDEEVHVGDVLRRQESFVGDVPLQYERPVEAGREYLAAPPVVFDDLDRVVALDRTRQSQSDVAAPAIMTLLTGASMRLNSCMTWRMSSVAARQNTSSPACTTVSPSGRIGLSPRNIAAMRVSTEGMCFLKSFSG